MKFQPMNVLLTIVFSMVLTSVPVVDHAQSSETLQSPPPVAQVLTREGDFAVKLVTALALEVTDNEAEAESRLLNIGISPRNGWIADYPVTPDIAGEVQKAVNDAADAGKLSIPKDEALNKVHDVIASLALPVAPSGNDVSAEAQTTNTADYLSPDAVGSYYYDEGPPIVTYYSPPPDYYYLYSWVAYPFWWSSFWFPGYYILNDFDRGFYEHGHRSHFSNHYHDGHNRMSRIDPVTRHEGRSNSGRSGMGSHDFASTNARRSAQAIFNGSQTRIGARNSADGRAFQSGRSMSQSRQSGYFRRNGVQFSGGNRSNFNSNPTGAFYGRSNRGSGTYGTFYRGNTVASPSNGRSSVMRGEYRGAGNYAPASRGGGSISHSFQGGSVTSYSGGSSGGSSSHGGGSVGSSFHGGGGSFGGGHRR